jgi:hypothetical protein
MYETKRLTVCLPYDMAAVVRKKAKTQNVTISRYFVECVEHRIAEEDRLLMIEGYQALSKEHIAFANAIENASCQN